MQRRFLLGGSAALAALAFSGSAAAQLRIEISGVGANQIPLAFIPMNGTAETGIDPFKVVSADLNRTGAFRIMEAGREATLEESVRPSLSPWSDKGAAMLAVGSVIRQADGNWNIRFRLFDVVKGEEIDRGEYLSDDRQLRMTSHRIADRIYTALTGFGAQFASRLAYVVEHDKANYELIIAESDGANAMPALKSREPIISPAWSPDGRQVAYVSFEEKKPVVFIHTVATGRRRVLANFRGNNSAPAFSPDGKKVALALSRDGFTQIFLINTDGTGVSRFSHSYAIDTEPVFSPDGKYLYFTSDRGGTAQIYRQAVDGGNAERVTFSGDYAVSPSLSPDGKTLTYITRSGRRYRVTVMNLATGEEMILTSTDLDESPCFSPNGQMIVYASERNKRGVLATVSADGTVKSWLTGSSGDIREPTWGPLLPEAL